MDADQYDPIVVDNEEPVAKRFLRRMRLGAGKTLKPQEPLPPVELKPYPDRPKQPDPGSAPFDWRAAANGVFSGVTNTSTAHPGPRTRGGAGWNTYSAPSWMNMYPPPGPNWRRWGMPAQATANHQHVPFYGTAWTVQSYAYAGLEVTATWQMRDRDMAVLMGPSYWQNGSGMILDTVARDFGTHDVIVEYMPLPDMWKVTVRWIA